MNDLAKFKAFFNNMGVEYCVLGKEYCVLSKVHFGPKIEGLEDQLTAVGVSQAWFMFTPDGEFLGVEAGEMGTWNPRVKKG